MSLIFYPYIKTYVGTMKIYCEPRTIQLLAAVTENTIPVACSVYIALFRPVYPS